MSEENKAAQPLAAGSTAPDFTLQARSGKTISLHDFAGQKDVLVYFYPKDDTPGCTREACSLRDKWADLTRAGIEVLGISRDDAASHNAFAEKYNLPFELLTDADHSVHEAYGAWGQNPNPAWGVGPLRKSFLIGKDGRIKHVFERVDTERHADQVMTTAGMAPAAPARPAAPPAPRPAPPAAAPAPKPVAAPAPKPAAPPAPKPAAAAPAVPAAKPAARKAAPKAAPRKKAARKPVKKAVKKVARAARKVVAKAKARRAVKKTVRRKAAPKKGAARRTARRSARKAVRTVRKTARKAKRVVRRAARKAGRTKKR